MAARKFPTSDPTRVSGSKDIQDKTPSPEKMQAKKQTVNQFRRQAKTNVLNNYRSYNYIFTLAALEKNALNDSSQYKNSSNYYVVAKSGGKGTKGITNTQRPSPTELTKEEKALNPLEKNLASLRNRVKDSGVYQLNNQLVAQFNSQSPGAKDFFINNVKIDTVMGGSKNTSMSIATNFDFDILEPYSMTGFLEALHVSAVAAGYASYAEACFLFKIEFVGYPDGDGLPDPVSIPNSSRYFVIRITGVDITVTESGALYKCKAVSVEQIAFGEANQLKDDIKMSGTKVGDILSNFINGINNSKIDDAQTTNQDEDKNLHDTYEIYFPLVTDTGIDTAYLQNPSGYEKNEIASKELTTLLKSNENYAFATPDNSTSTTVVSYSPTSNAVSFSKGQNIHECIISVVRDSNYTKDILKGLNEGKIADSKGMIKYFMVHVELEFTGKYNKNTNSPVYKYRYLVIPYQIHLTRIKPKPDGIIDTTQLKLSAHRIYNYIYTGKNVDILNFQLRFNNLYFQAIAKVLGDQTTSPAADKSVQPSNPISSKFGQGTTAAQANNYTFGISRKITPVDITKPVVDGTPNAGVPQVDPYARLSKNMHESILENTDQCTAEVEIIGDPYYLVTGGSGNQKLKLNSDGTAGDGEAPYTTSDVSVVMFFKNPVDIDPVTGFANFNNAVAEYSGVFQVTQVESKFNDGLFTQKINLVRIPGQVEDVDTSSTPYDPNNPAVSSLTPAFVPVPDPSKAAVEPTIIPEATSPAVQENSSRASYNALLASIANGLPITGLPGDLSNLVPGFNNNLGSLSNLASIGSLINSVKSNIAGATNAAGALINQVTGSAAQGLSNISTVLRLAKSGLSGISINYNSAGGSVAQLSLLGKSIGFSNSTPDNLARSILSSGAKLSNEIGYTAMSAVNRLESNSAGLINGISAKIGNLHGNSAALGIQLGINPSVLSGLSINLQSSILHRISSLAATVPRNVDLNNEIKNGILIDNLPPSALANLPATQPFAVAPPPSINLSDVQFNVSQGVPLSTMPGIYSVYKLDTILSNNVSSDLNNPASLLTNGGLDYRSVANKFSTLQAGIVNITGNGLSIEASLNNVNNVVPSGLPYTANISASVIAKFGSKSGSASSPLTVLIQGNTG